MRVGRSGSSDWRNALSAFIDRTDRVLALIEDFMPEADWLDDGDTLTYLHSCISTRRQRVRVPETPMHLDAILVDEDAHRRARAASRQRASPHPHHHGLPVADLARPAR